MWRPHSYRELVKEMECKFREEYYATPEPLKEYPDAKVGKIIWMNSIIE
jgi:hypothetical protein